MAFRQLTVYEYLCLSTDTKTIVGINIGARCYETDASEWFIFDGSAWFELEQPVIQTEHKRVHLGKEWDISAIYDAVVDDANADLVVTTGVKELHVLHNEAASGDAYGYVYEAPTVTGGTGTPATVMNSNRVVGDAGAPTALVDPTITDVGTKLVQWFSPGGTGGKASGEGGSRDTEIVLAPSTDYLFRLTNKKGNNAIISWTLHAYFHD